MVKSQSIGTFLLPLLLSFLLLCKPVLPKSEVVHPVFSHRHPGGSYTHSNNVKISNVTSARKLQQQQQQQRKLPLINGFMSVRGKRTRQLDNPPKSLQDALEQLSQMGNHFQYLIADVDQDKGECDVREGNGVDDPAPIASMFKLWVLGAVLEAIKEGTISWDQEIFIKDEQRSLPTGIVQEDPPGSSRTVLELAELMIMISDNTATDLLMGLVGRAATRQTLNNYGHHNPELNHPFFNTKEWLILKLDGAKGDGLPGPLGQQYIESNQLERHLLLTRLQNTVINFGLDPSAWEGGPIAIEELEWFGSPMDICKSMVHLHQDEEAARILSINPGVINSDNAGIWSYIGFKGGSEPGVLGLSWYLVPEIDDNAEDGSENHHRHQVVTGILWDTENEIDEAKAFLLLDALRDLSRKEATSVPTKTPTSCPTTTAPTAVPSSLPTQEPSIRPSATPSNVPSNVPTENPTTSEPSRQPSVVTSAAPTTEPTTTPSTNRPTSQEPSASESITAPTVVVQTTTPTEESTSSASLPYYKSASFFGQLTVPLLLTSCLLLHGYVA